MLIRFGAPHLTLLESIIVARTINAMNMVLWNCILSIICVKLP